MSDKLMYADDLIQFVKHWGELRGREEAADSFLYAINNAPAVDAVEVTRCEKCQYRFDSIDSESKEEVMFCNLEHGLAGIINSDDFCSYGERRDENGES